MGDVKENGTLPEDGPTPQSLVSEKYVAEVLTKDKGSDALLISWEMEDFTKKGDNYACVVSSVKVKFSQEGKEQQVVYVVKMNPCRNFESFREFTRMVFEKEASFYLSLVPELNRILENTGHGKLQVPRCIYASLETDRELIFLEDLRPRGFKMFDRRKGLDIAHASLILKELGKLHAASVLLQAETPEEKLSDKYEFLKRDWAIPDKDSKMDIAQLFDGYLVSGIDLLKPVDGYERAVAWVESLRPKLKDLLRVKLGQRDFNVICHGDCWNNNVLFRYDEEGHPLEVMLLDLQCCRYSSPVTDLVYLIYTSITGEVRQPNLSAFLSTYHDSFSALLRAADAPVSYPEEKLVKEFRDYNDLAAIFCMMLLPIILMKPDDVPEFENRTDEEIEEIMNEFHEASKNMFQNDPLMRPRFLAMFDEFMEAGLIP